MWNPNENNHPLYKGWGEWEMLWLFLVCYIFEVTVYSLGFTTGYFSDKEFLQLCVWMCWVNVLLHAKYQVWRHQRSLLELICFCPGSCVGSWWRWLVLATSVLNVFDFSMYQHSNLHWHQVFFDWLTQRGDRFNINFQAEFVIG